ncbi:hypothetical protein OAE73_00240 [bacterium]|nr:hypothetical protein [bacterium]
MELKEEGAFDFDKNNVSHLLRAAAERGLKSQILYSAMDYIRDNPNLTNDEAIILGAKRWNLVNDDV